jgi:hypothetical protein
MTHRFDKRKTSLIHMYWTPLASSVFLTKSIASISRSYVFMVVPLDHLQASIVAYFQEMHINKLAMEK